MSSPSLMKHFFDKITASDSELREFINAMKYIQFDGSLTSANKTNLLIQTMIENMQYANTEANTTGSTNLANLTDDNVRITPTTKDESKNGSEIYYYTNYVETTGSYTLKHYQLKTTIDNGDIKYERKEITDTSIYKIFIKDKLKKLLDDKKFRLFTTPAKNIDELSDGQKGFNSFTDKNELPYTSSILDLILDLEKHIPRTYIANTSDIMYNSLSNDQKMFESLNKFLNSTTAPKDENSLIMDIVAKQKNIEDSKNNIKDLRNKIYTYLSRDKNYSKSLHTKRMMLYLSVSFLILISLLYTGVLVTNKLPIPDKSTIILAITSIVLITNAIIYIMRVYFGTKETFSQGYTFISGKGFTVDTSDTKIDVPMVMEKLVVEYVDVLSKEIKNEYYDALYESQKKDEKLIEQLEKEHNLKSHFHQLKNNLTYFKINETKEYSKLSQLLIVVTSLLALLYVAVLQDTIDMKIFKIVSGLSFVLLMTYILLTVKSIMLRDKYDWDRFNWTVKNVNSTLKDENCSSFPGFPQ